jgi:hypothetical protein
MLLSMVQASFHKGLPMRMAHTRTHENLVRRQSIDAREATVELF